MDSIRLKARAKINLGLDVLGKREDGYHEVRMVMQTIGIYDRLILTKIPEEEIRITSNLAFLPVNENNLIYKAIKLLKDEYHFPGGVSVDLNKFIPVAAGMAGGRACKKLYVGLSYESCKYDKRYDRNLPEQLYTLHRLVL